MISEVAGHYKGAFPIPWAMTMTWREFKLWYMRYLRELSRDGITHDYAKRDKPIPSMKMMNRLIDKKIKEWFPEGITLG